MEKTILDLAQELGKLVSKSEVLVKYIEAKKAYEEDKHLHSLINEYNIQQTALEKLSDEDAKNEQLVGVIRNRIQQLYDEASQNENMARFDSAENDLNDLLASVNDTIREEIFKAYPEMRPSPSSCSGNCAGCSGCH